MNSVGTEGEPHSLWEENTAASMWEQDRVRPLYRVLTSALPTQPERVSTTADIEKEEIKFYSLVDMIAIEEHHLNLHSK